MYQFSKLLQDSKACKMIGFNFFNLELYIIILYIWVPLSITLSKHAQTNSTDLVKLSTANFLNFFTVLQFSYLLTYYCSMFVSSHYIFFVFMQ